MRYKFIIFLMVLFLPNLCFSVESIVVKKKDHGVVIIHPNLDKYGEGKTPYSQCKALQKYINPSDPNFTVMHEWFVTDEKIDMSDLESREQLYWEEKDGETFIKKDFKWEHRIIPANVIKKRLLKNNTLKLDSELAKNNPNIINVLKLQRKIDEIKNMKKFDQSLLLSNEMGTQ